MSGSAGGLGLGRPVHPPIPTIEFEQPELLAAEKEAIGLFVSAHPLKPLKEALRAKVDCAISSLADRRDKDMVTVGGIITETKKIRTRNGDHMMFAMLDDLAGSVEMLIFGKALAENEHVLLADEVVIVKGRVDHKEAGATSLVVQSIQRFAPSAEEIERARAKAETAAASSAARARPVHLRVSAAALSPNALDDLKQAIEDFPGAAEVLIDIDTSEGIRRVRLGERFRVANTPTLLADSKRADARRLGRLDGPRGLSPGNCWAEGTWRSVRADLGARLVRQRGAPCSAPGAKHIDASEAQLLQLGAGQQQGAAVGLRGGLGEPVADRANARRAGGAQPHQEALSAAGDVGDGARSWPAERGRSFLAPLVTTLPASVKEPLMGP